METLKIDLTTFPTTSKFARNSQLRVEFSTLLLAACFISSPGKGKETAATQAILITEFGDVVKHNLLCFILLKREHAIFTQSALRCDLPRTSVLSQIVLQVFQHLTASPLEFIQVVQCIFRSTHVLRQFCLQYPQRKWYHRSYRGRARNCSIVFK